MKGQVYNCCSVAPWYRLFVTPWTAAHQAFLSFTISQSLLKLKVYNRCSINNSPHHHHHHLIHLGNVALSVSLAQPPPPQGRLL